MELPSLQKTHKESEEEKMTYEYKELQINLEGDEVYWLWDLISFALDLDAEKNVLTDDKRSFARRLLNVTDEHKN